MTAFAAFEETAALIVLPARSEIAAEAMETVNGEPVCDERPPLTVDVTIHVVFEPETVETELNVTVDAESVVLNENPVALGE
mgnify:CR=1 FL=1